MSVRGKFVVDSVTAWKSGQKEVSLSAVTGNKDGVPEDKSYARYTPNGSIKLTVDNPPAAEQFQPGKVFYVDFTEAEQ